MKNGQQDKLCCPNGMTIGGFCYCLSRAIFLIRILEEAAIHWGLLLEPINSLQVALAANRRSCRNRGVG